MFRSPFSLASAAIACLLAAPPVLAADALLLDNGDRLTGALIRIEDGTVHFDTGYAGALTIDLGAVWAIETAEPRVWEDAAGELREGRFIAAEDGVGVAAADGFHEVSPGDIAVLYPAGVEPGVPDAPVEPEEPEEPEEEPGPWSGAVETGVAFRSGPIDSFDGHARLTAKREAERTVLSLSLSGAYGEVESELNKRRLRGQSKLQVYLQDRFYVYGLTGLEHDGGRALDLRANIAGGSGYDIIDSERRFWSADIGVDYQWERWRQYNPAERRRARDAAWAESVTAARAFLEDVRADPERLFNPAGLREAVMVGYELFNPPFEDRRSERDDWNIRLSSYYEQKVFTRSELEHELVVLPKLGDNLGEFRLVSDLGFVTPLTDALDLRLSLESEFDSEPGRGVRGEWDNTLRSTLRYQF